MTIFMSRFAKEFPLSRDLVKNQYLLYALFHILTTQATEAL